MAEQQHAQSLAIDAAVSEFQTSFHALCNQLQLLSSPPQSSVQQQRRQVEHSEQHQCPFHSSSVRENGTHPMPLPVTVQQVGSRPNIYFRAIPHSHLRGHPFYQPLPHPCTVRVRTVHDVLLFRQDSWQWDAMHAGRVTGSCAAACLGLLEPFAASELGIPRSRAGRGKTLRAVERLRQPPLCTLDQLKQLQEPSAAYFGDTGVGTGACVLLPTDGCEGVWARSAASVLECEGKAQSVDANRCKGLQPRGKDQCTDIGTPRSCETYLADHTPAPGLQPPRNARRRWSPGSLGRVRMAWGSAQEATGLLAGLNYFYATAGAKLEECGLFPAEATVNLNMDAATGTRVPTGAANVTANRPLLGASPDGLLRFPDGHTEVLEVKCHAPFAPNASGHGGQFCIRDRGPYDDVGPWHIPQLMLEVYCAGSNCTAANLLSLSATRGARIFRVERDEPMLQCMVALYARFYEQFCTGSRPIPPPKDFWKHDEQAAWLRGRILVLSRSATRIATIPNDMVQRSRILSCMPLFFNNIG